MHKIKVLWICSFSSEKVRPYYEVHYSLLERIAMRCVGRKVKTSIDSAIWNVNAINEMEKRNDVELHILSPIRNLSKKRTDFTLNGVHYHYFRDENSSTIRKIRRYLFTRNSAMFAENCRQMRTIMGEIVPDLVHVIGAENPYYSLGLLEVPEGIPTILQLQALLCTLIEKSFGATKQSFAYKAELEKLLIDKADFIGTTVSSFIEYIKKYIKADANIVNTSLAMAQEINLEPCEKKFDFVHYAASLSYGKATDVALKAFAIVHKKYPTATLELIGQVTDEIRPVLEETIAREGLGQAVTIQGMQATHEDVVRLMRQARFALLPLKHSIVPNTLHEAMANGLPLLTTETLGTPMLNLKRQSCLISAIGDYEDIAKNMMRLFEDDCLVETLRQNAAQTEGEYENNEAIIAHWVDIYRACINNKKNGIPIPNDFLI